MFDGFIGNKLVVIPPTQFGIDRWVPEESETDFKGLFILSLSHFYTAIPRGGWLPAAGGLELSPEIQIIV